MKSLKKALERRQITSNPVSVRELLQLYQADSVKGLLIKMGPFVPSSDAFIFGNDFDLTAPEAAQALDIIPVVILDLVNLSCINEVKNALDKIKVEIPVPIFENPTVYLSDVLSFDSIINRVSSFILQENIGNIEHLKDPLVGDSGFCGGMAFAGYDFYRQGWSVARFSTLPPVGDELHVYIFQRLLDSLGLNGATFVEWWTKVHILPKVSPIASAALSAAVGGLAGPVGSAFGALIGGKEDFLDLGGPKSVLGPTKEQWPIIKDRLDNEAAWPIGLIFGNRFNLFDQHQILAINYTDNGSGIATLTVWDNNDARGSAIRSADGSNTLTIDFQGDELEVSALPKSDIALNDKQIKGIFLQEYTPRQPPSSLGPP